MKKPIALSLSILFLSLNIAPTLNAEIYYWIDKNGNKVYGDSPKKGTTAEEVKLKPLTILGFPEAKEQEPVEAGEDGEMSGTTYHKAATIKYTAITITSPAQDATIRDGSGAVTISIKTEPALAKGHKIQVSLDGTSFGDAKPSTTITLNNVDRGTHSVSASLIDEKGTKLISSDSVTFHLHRTIVKKGG